jgi:cytochrome P450
LNDNDDGASDSFVRLAYEAMMKDRTGEGSATRKLNHDDREELIFTIRDLFVAGGDTSSVNLQLALILLANNPEAQSRMQKELDSVVGPDRLPSLDDEPNLPFSQAVLLETMRRYTAISLSVPRETTTDVQLGKLFIPAGTMVTM